MEELTTKDVRTILDDIVSQRLLDGDLAKKTLKDDLKMDSLDIAIMITEIEKLVGVPTPDEIWDKWEHDLRSLTVKQIIDDCNHLL